MARTLLKCVGTGLLALAPTVVASNQKAVAQVDESRPVVVEDDSFDWGWLGLLGLLGLGGLMRSDRHHTSPRDTTTTAGAHTART